MFASRAELPQGYGWCLASVGDYAHAPEEYRQLLLTHPEMRPSRYNLAVALWKLKESRQALDVLEPLLEGSTDETALVLGSQIAEEAGDTPRAVQLQALGHGAESEKDRRQLSQLSPKLPSITAPLPSASTC